MANPDTHHCQLSRLLTTEEVERVESLFRQQGIVLSEVELMAHIQKIGGKEDCPFRAVIGEGTAYCSSHCHLDTVIKNKTEEESK